ncbi:MULTISPECIES: carbon storage regulator CsrA [unclassified Fusibacter]|uniref:carbon storage regulator CsrA n=1 Tax=unclassified Fusibacter TaxID=2624464 RepID=UPI00101065BC|nr:MULTISPECIES: carbon storage regulator CsrA [unclassified Fusibacter]MCK8059835.1 carbon storage regulator CsrA [Fusibacter sp. A2]NPE21637.1 carbon storage regulator CsrA [Fusibacter sp. A1]RXV62041.1 carbon storage regulator [Fusibacter sp. A1]
MLSLTRKLEESIIINGNIEVKILGVSEGKVRLGISAPKTIEVHRKEVYEQIQEENKAAALSAETIDVLKKKLYPENK